MPLEALKFQSVTYLEYQTVGDLEKLFVYCWNQASRINHLMAKGQSRR